ncbi:hypothetical protein ACFVVC_01990 [Pseudarthrobacter sp. NPDC058196]|uniref:hypothetical protein n=1 Tax=Pseudarthrobacter sp. NPDC058196 TaxID=3346376 RepID=UPI0036DE9AD9
MTPTGKTSRSARRPEPKLSPYDTGARCEAKPWIPYGERVTEATPAENFGKVDFEDDEGSTVCVAYLERDKDGGYTLHVTPMCEDREIRVEVNYECGSARMSSTKAAADADQ